MCMKKRKNDEVRFKKFREFLTFAAESTPNTVCYTGYAIVNRLKNGPSDDYDNIFFNVIPITICGIVITAVSFSKNAFCRVRQEDNDIVDDTRSCCEASKKALVESGCWLLSDIITLIGGSIAMAVNAGTVTCDIIMSMEMIAIFFILLGSKYINRYCCFRCCGKHNVDEEMPEDVELSEEDNSN